MSDMEMATVPGPTTLPTDEFSSHGQGLDGSSDGKVAFAALAARQMIAEYLS